MNYFKVKMKNSITRRYYCFLFIAIASLFLSTHLHAQTRLSLEINAGVLHSFGRDIIKTYRSNTQPFGISPFTRKKFEQPYFNLLPNLNYAVNPNLSLGLQTGIYAHFYERYFGQRIPITVTVPLMATFRCNLMNIKSNTVGINVAGGKNFFRIDADIDQLKNGWVFNASLFYLLNKKSMIKLGVEQEVDNAYVYFIGEYPYTKDETFKYHLNRVSASLSYCFVIEKL